jgi:hypothetical protein
MTYDFQSKDFYFQKYIEERKKVNPNQIKEEREANYFIKDLRLLSEFNKWSLLLSQKWLVSFYKELFWNKIALELLKYDVILSTDMIMLEVCSGYNLGYYMKNVNKIVLCANLLSNYDNKQLFNFAIKRQLIHMYDNIRDKSYDIKDCNKLACTEIRAVNLNGLCTESYTYYNSIFNKHHRNQALNESCVKDNAINNLAHDFEHCIDVSIKAVDKMFDKCVSDLTPIFKFSQVVPYT